jgi:hypothetical protein
MQNIYQNRNSYLKNTKIVIGLLVEIGQKLKMNIYLLHLKKKTQEDCINMFHSYYFEISKAAQNEPYNKQFQEQYIEYVDIVKN